MRIVAVLLFVCLIAIASVFVFREDGPEPLFASEDDFYEARLRDYAKSSTVMSPEEFLARVERAKAKGTLLVLHCEVYGWKANGDC